MTAVTVEHQTAEPGKRVLRAVLAWVIAVAFVLPIILGMWHVPKGTEVGWVVTQVVAVATAITGLMAIPQVNALLKKIGLGATTVTKLKTAVLSAADPLEPAISAAITAALAAQKQVDAGNLSDAVQTVGTAAAAIASTAEAEVPLVKGIAAATK